MKIYERIEEMQSKLIKIVTETNLNAKEEGIRILEEFGLDIETATELIETYQNAENAKELVKNVWNSALNSKSGVDFSTDIEKSQQKVADTRQYFDEFTSKCALLIVARRLEPNKINDEILGKLYDEGIQEEQINNPALKITYHYYCEAKEMQKERKADSEKVRAFSSRVKSNVIFLKRSLEESKKQYEILNRAYTNLQYKYSIRIIEDEKHYQDALSLIGELKVKINQLQSRGIFQVLGDKISGKNKTKRLPRGNSELPETLCQSKAEEIGISEIDKDILTTTSEQTQPSSDKRTDKKDEWQQ